MMRNTQKIVFTALAAAVTTAILSFLLLTCVPFGPPDYDEDYEYTNVEYSPDGGTVTIYLDGSMPVRQSRAINLKWAQIGHDFFEVAFHYPTTNTVARAVWEVGHAAGVNGVARDVNYASAVPITPAAGQGAAILFVGKKSDKTLLGLGRLIGTNDPANGGATFVSADTKSVTFEVAAIDVGVSGDRTVSSFLTAAGGGTGTNVTVTNTSILPGIRIGRRFFPLFRFTAETRTVWANYTFKVYDPKGIVNIGTFSNGVLQAGPASLLMSPTEMDITPSSYRLRPRYPLGDGNWESSHFYINDGSTSVTFRNNTPSGTSPFQNPIEFQFGINAANTGQLFAFSFEVPVYPLTNDGGRNSSNLWYLRPGYDSYKYDLDDGEGGSGGAILVGTGNFASSSYYLWVNPPDKAVYPGSPVEYSLDLYGIMAELRIGNEEDYSILVPILSIPPQTGYADYDSNLKFYLGTGAGRREIIGGTDLSLYVLPGGTYYNSDFITSDGMITVNVEYTYSGVMYPATFTLFLYTLGGTPGSDLIPEENRFIIASDNELLEYMPKVTGTAGNYIFVFFDSFTMPTFTLNGTGSYYIIIIAAKPDVVVSAAGGLGFNVPSGTNNNDFYLGKWPFNDTLSVQGLAITSYPLTVNTNNTFINSDAGVTTTVVEGPGFKVTGGGSASN